jgi:uncharacterized membrane protein YfcA
LILLLASALGGASNALAGGGTFLVFPALLLAGVLPIQANATASLVLLPGAFASAWVYRDIITGRSLGSSPGFLIRMLSMSLAGSAAGSILLLATPNDTFSSLVPWLLLMATAVFTLAPWIRNKATSSRHEAGMLMMAGQFIISIYGGYFGAGMGVLMIALYLVATKLDVHAASGLRLVCGAVINLLAVAIFTAKGAVDFKIGIPMLLASTFGGYVGALLVKKLNAELARKAILVYAWILTAWFFVKMWVK